MSALAPFARSRSVRTSRRVSFTPQLTALEAREVPSVTAVFNTSVLSVVGDANANAIILIGGAGADRFVRRQTNTSTTSPMYDEVVLDFSAAEGDVVVFLPPK